MDLKKAIKSVDEATSLYFYVFIFLMAGIGFLTGIFSLGFLITKITGVWPPVLTLFLNGFNVALYIGFGLITLRWILMFVQIIKKKRGKK